MTFKGPLSLLALGLTVVGCAAVAPGVKLPATTPDPTNVAGGLKAVPPPSELSLGLANAAYSVQAQGSPVYGKVIFKLSKIEIHRAGTLTSAELASAPVPVKGLAYDLSGSNTDGGDTEPTASDSAWLTFPVQLGATVDLTTLTSTPINLGLQQLSAGKYDQVRLTGDGTYEIAGVGTGSFTLPSGRLYLKSGFELRDGYQTQVKFGFDPASSIVMAGPKVLLKPNSVKLFARYTPIATSSATSSVPATASI